MEIKILGPGCKNCEKLAQEVKNCLAEMNLEAAVEKVENTDDIMEYDVFMTPGLVINQRVKSSGRVPRKEEIQQWIQEEK